MSRSSQRLLLSLIQLGLQLAQVYVYRRICIQHQAQVQAYITELEELKNSNGVTP